MRRATHGATTAVLVVTVGLVWAYAMYAILVGLAAWFVTSLAGKHRR